MNSLMWTHLHIFLPSLSEAEDFSRIFSWSPLVAERSRTEQLASASEAIEAIFLSFPKCRTQPLLPVNSLPFSSLTLWGIRVSCNPMNTGRSASSSIIILCWKNGCPISMGELSITMVMEACAFFPVLLMLFNVLLRFKKN